eukprot:SAG25_NODE_11802_length_295_cov_0.443878_1_plen_53_part_01
MLENVTLSTAMSPCHELPLEPLNRIFTVFVGNVTVCLDQLVYMLPCLWPPVDH